jgi:cold shock CspA family protein
MGRSQETYNKKEVRNKKEKKRKAKEQKRIARRESEKKSSLDDMIAYVDENGIISSVPPDPSKKKEIDLKDIKTGPERRDPSEIEEITRKGTVRYFNASKGYGFITDSESKESIFFHINNLLEEVNEGNLVSFQVQRGHKGLTASQVKLYK